MTSVKEIVNFITKHWKKGETKFKKNSKYYEQKNLQLDIKKAKKYLVAWTKKRTKTPIVVIGGINNKNFKTLMKIGANYLAISSYIWNNPRLKPKKAIREFN